MGEESSDDFEYFIILTQNYELPTCQERKKTTEVARWEGRREGCFKTQRSGSKKRQKKRIG
jgi:hypothetical protein